MKSYIVAWFEEDGSYRNDAFRTKKIARQFMKLLIDKGLTPWMERIK